MRKIATATLLTVFCLTTPLLAEVRWFGSLPTDGTLFAPYWCGGAKLVKSESEGLPAKYYFEGTCDVVVKLPGLGMFQLPDVPLRANAKFDGAWASESIDVTIGTISTKVRCEKDPFRHGNSSCLTTDAQVNVSQKANPISLEMYPPQLNGHAYIPVLAGKITGEAQSGLTAGTGQTDLEDWNPFAEVPAEPASIRIEAPTSYEILPPGAGYTVSFAPKARSTRPATVHLQFERLVAVPKGGDVALPAGKTHWWQPAWAVGAAWRSLPFQVGDNKATLHLKKPGLYRVRGRALQAQGDYQGGWTEWRTFCVGAEGTCGNIEALGKMGEDTLKVVADSVKSKMRVRQPPPGRVPKN
ncbi:MAG: hypothetical protein ACR2QF_00420 [Geminicoccaceae bacterium]